MTSPTWTTYILLYTNYLTSLPVFQYLYLYFMDACRHFQGQWHQLFHTSSHVDTVFVRQSQMWTLDLWHKLTCGHLLCHTWTMALSHNLTEQYPVTLFVWVNWCMTLIGWKTWKQICSCCWFGMWSLYKTRWRWRSVVCVNSMPVPHSDNYVAELIL